MCIVHSSVSKDRESTVTMYPTPEIVVLVTYFHWYLDAVVSRGRVEDLLGSSEWLNGMTQEGLFV